MECNWSFGWWKKFVEKKFDDLINDGERSKEWYE